MKTQRNMFKDDQERPNYADRNSEDVFSIPVRAGKRTYFFDVKTTKGNNDYYLTITESKRRQEQDGILPGMSSGGFMKETTTAMSAADIEKTVLECIKKLKDM